MKVIAVRGADLEVRDDLVSGEEPLEILAAGPRHCIPLSASTKMVPIMRNYRHGGATRRGALHRIGRACDLNGREATPHLHPGRQLLEPSAGGALCTRNPRMPTDHGSVMLPSRAVFPIGGAGVACRAVGRFAAKSR